MCLDSVCLNLDAANGLCVGDYSSAETEHE